MLVHNSTKDCPNLHAPIIPNVGLGGFQLRAPLIDFQDTLMKCLSYEPPSFSLNTPFEACYQFENGSIEVWVDVRNGKVFKITAKNGYQGQLFEGVMVGLNAGEGMKRHPALFYDESEELILCKSVRGVSLDISETDPPPDLVPALSISAISTYIQEIDTLPALEGKW